MKLKKKWGDKISFEWNDAFTKEGWLSCDEALEIDEGSVCCTNAYYLSHNDTWLVVCHTREQNKDQNVMGVLSVPWMWIKKVK